MLYLTLRKGQNPETAEVLLVTADRAAIAAALRALQEKAMEEEPRRPEQSSQEEVRRERRHQ